MIHLVLVSHSSTLAEGIYQLATQMSPHPETIHLAAGIDDLENPIGTDATKIMAAIEAADNPDGILILIDLGSALLSAETALELIDPDLAQRCKISSAPLVEGSITAAITAGTGADLETVAQAAENALDGKKSTLGESQPAPSAPSLQKDQFDQTTDIILQNPHGLHARPAAQIVAKMSAFCSQIFLEKDGQYADGKNLNQILALSSRAGDKIYCYATGDDAEAAIKAFQQLAAENFGEPLSSSPEKEALTQATVIRAETVCGEVFRPQKLKQTAKAEQIEDLKNAIAAHSGTLEMISNEVSAWLGKEYGEIFSAQKMLLEDMTEEALQFVAQNDDIGKGWHEFCRSQAETLEKLDNPYLQARSFDIWDLEQGVSRELNKDYPDSNVPYQPFIYVAEDIFPSQVWCLSDICEEEDSTSSQEQWRLGEFCKAVVLAKGNPYSHAVILLKALNIPVFIDAGEKILNLTTGEKIHLDLTTGKITHS